MQPTAIFLSGESHEQRSLVGYSPWGRKELAVTEATQHARRYFYISLESFTIFDILDPWLSQKASAPISGIRGYFLLRRESPAWFSETACGEGPRLPSSKRAPHPRRYTLCSPEACQTGTPAPASGLLPALGQTLELILTPSVQG